MSLATVAGVVPCAVAQAPFVDLEAGVLHDDNVGRAARSRDTVDDEAAEVFGRLGTVLDVPGDSTLTLAGSLRATQFRHLEDLGESSLGGSVSWRHKYGLGANAPWLALAAAGERIDSDSRIRDGWLWSASLSGGKRIGERWNLLGGIRLERRDGDADRQVRAGPAIAGATTRGDVFDQRALELHLTGECTLGERWLLSVGYRYRDGDVVSTGVSFSDIALAADAITRDTAFGASTMAYRLDARTHVLWLGLDYALTESASIDVAWEYQGSDAPRGIDYDKNQLRLRWLYSY